MVGMSSIVVNLAFGFEKRRQGRVGNLFISSALGRGAGDVIPR